MRSPARKPVAAVVRTLCVSLSALVVAGLVGVPAATAAPAPCPDRVAPPPAVDSSETLAPAQPSPTPVPEPATPAGGPRMAECGYVLPAGAPALPKDLGFESWVLQDLDTGTVLAAKDPHARQRPASLIKLLLAQVVARELNPDTVVIGTQADANQQGTRVGIGPGGKYTVGMLVKALLMASGNDAAYALAMQLGGVQTAVDKMNALARQLGAQDIRAASPSGLDAPGMSASAYDLSIVFRVDLATPLLATAMHTTRMPFPGYGKKPSFTLNNDNLLLRTYPGDIGGKVGYTTDAQQTYANAAERDGHRIALVMTRGANHIVGRWQNARELMNYGFALENAHTAPVGFISTQLAATAVSPTTVAKQAAAAPTTGHGGAQVATVPQGQLSAFGNVGLPLTLLAALAVVLIGLLYLKRQRAKKARAAAAARVASAETVRVALPPDLGRTTRTRRPGAEHTTNGATRAMPGATQRQRPPAQPGTRGQAMPAGHQSARTQAVPRQPQPQRQQAPRPANPARQAPEWPTGPEWPA
ncbi:MAG TPA: serine hydrolase [Pseudonocardiaceae bacterium]|nr:serine hydrolase [Pseudonocardiaceae bacterium]